MGKNDTVKLSDILGHVEVKQFSIIKDNVETNYCWSIRYDYEGNEVSRTTPTIISTMDLRGVDYEKSSS